MALQQQDFIRAQQLQKQLLMLVPGDPQLKAFDAVLPDEVAEQKAQNKAYAGQESEYESEEDYGPESDDEKKSEGEQKSQEDPHADAVSTVGEEVKEAEESSDDYNPEYYDEEGKYIWGAEGEDWEFYDEEDRIAYH